jgi:hypothetical protein
MSLRTPSHLAVQEDQPMSGDPSDNGVPPDRATIELALRVAQKRLTEPPASYDPGNMYWRGAAETLRWSLGQRGIAPVSERQVAANLDAPRRTAVNQEAQYAYECMRGDRRLPEDVSQGYLTGAENTLCWVAGGRGFAMPLDPSWLREHYGIR